MSSSSSSSSSDRAVSKRRIYITGYSSKEDPHDIKKIFKKFGKIEEFSWKGKFCFIVQIVIVVRLVIRGARWGVQSRQENEQGRLQRLHTHRRSGSLAKT